MKKLILVVMMLLVPCAVFAGGFGKPDPVQLQFVQQLTGIHHKLIELYTDQLRCYHQIDDQDEIEYRAYQHRGSVPHHLRRERKNLERQELEIQSKITELKRKQEQLRVTVLQVYNGKLPKWLGNAWLVETTRYTSEWKAKIEPELKRIKHRQT